MECPNNLKEMKESSEQTNPDVDQESYKQIMKSTGIIGGSQIINILIGIVRTKVVAILLGPLGYGVMSSLQATTDLMRQATSFGINLSAVREISQSIDTQDSTKIARIVLIIRRWAIYTGILGSLLTLLLCYPLSQYAFNSDEYALEIAFISVVLFTTSISSVQVSLLQGFRQLRKMALASIWGAVLGIIISVPMYYFYGIDGIVPAIITTSLGSIIVTTIYTRKIKIKKPTMTFKQTIIEGRNIAKLGLYIVITCLIVSLIMYTTRAFIIRKMDMDAVGIFQVAWTVSNIYIGIVLSSMGADFFPRLSAIHTDIQKSNKLINQQMDMALLAITPLLIALIGAAPLVIYLLYSADFMQAVPILQWQLSGGLFTVIAWCMGVTFLAKNKGQYALITESIWGIMYLALVVVLWDHIGFLSLGIAYLISSAIKAVMILMVIKKIANYKIASTTRNIILFSISATISILINVNLLTGIYQYITSAIIFIATTTYCISQLNKIIDLKQIINKLRKR